MRHDRRRSGNPGRFGLFALLFAPAVLSWRAPYTLCDQRGGPCPLFGLGVAHHGTERSDLVVCGTPADCAALVTYSEADVREVARALTGWRASYPTRLDTEESAAYVPPAVIYESQSGADTIFWLEARALQQTSDRLHLPGQKGDVELTSKRSGAGAVPAAAM